MKYTTEGVLDMFTRYCHEELEGLVCISKTIDGRCLGSRACPFSKKYPREKDINKVKHLTNLITYTEE